MSSIQDMEPGDFVKVGSNDFAEISSISGVSSNGRLAKPSEGGFSVITKEGRRASMWEARAYCKKDDLPKDARVVDR